MDPRAKSFFRPDIEGLRAVAVLLVLVFHVGAPLVGGFIGVDLFFVISGFLITSLLLREVEKTGTISLTSFYARRAKRLLPAASVVLVGTALAIRFLGPSAQRSTFAGDVVASAAYFVNWRFAWRSVDYLAEDVGRSPVLHFWSLSVEEQFYFVWPVLIVSAVFVARRFRLSPGRTMATALAVVLVPSLAWSIFFGAKNSSEAFFVTTTRLWELGMGALLAISSQRLSRVSARLGTPLTLLGAALIGGCAYFVDKASPWPSYLALGPTLGAALIIAGGGLDGRGPVSSFLSSRIMVWIGGLSYSIYLWHWPFLVVGQDWLGLRGVPWGTGLVLMSLVPAWLSFRFVETPIRFSSRLEGQPQLLLSLGINASLGCVALGLLVAVTSQRAPAATVEQHVQLSSRAGRVLASPASLGAGSLGHEGRAAASSNPPGGRFVPAALLAPKDVPRAYGDRCQVKFEGVRPTWCKYGAAQGKTKVVLAGDSKVLQYSEALDAIGKARGWKITTATKSSCAFTAAMTVRAGAPYRECRAFYDEVMEQLRKSRPDVVITSQQASTALAGDAASGETTEAMVAGLVEAWTQLRAWGAEVVVLLDNPNAKGNPNIYQCVADHPDHLEACSFSRKESSSAAAVQLKAAQLVPGVRIIDPVEHICPGERCAPVIGGVLVYRQGSHITNTYARTLAPWLDEELKAVLAR